MHRYPITLLALVLATCQPADVQLVDGELDAGSALLALDLDDAFATPAAAAANEAGPTAAELYVDDHKVARIALPSDGSMLEGRAAWQLKAEREVEVSVALVGLSNHIRSEPVRVLPGANTVVRIRAHASHGDSETNNPTLVMEVQSESQLTEDDGAAVDYTATNRAQARVQRFGAHPAATVLAILRDPNVAVVTPELAAPSSAQHIGPLVAFHPVNEDRSAVRQADAAHHNTTSRAATATQPTLRKPSEAGVDVDRSKERRESTVTIAPPTTAANSAIAAFIYYYSYCTCGKPVVNRAYTLTAKDGAGEPVLLKGHTDFFGMVHARDITDASLNFGAGQRQRQRSYNFVAGTEQSRHDVLTALAHPDPNEVLTALLDLRRQPLPSAKAKLIELLGSDNEVAWRNAAVTLSFYEDVDALVTKHSEALRSGTTGAERSTYILGALRRSAALPSLHISLQSNNAALRRVGAWAVGFIAAEAGIELLAPLANDPNAMVRAEVALALGRIGNKHALEVLEQLLGDDDPKVEQRAQQAIARST